MGEIREIVRVEAVDHYLKLAAVALPVLAVAALLAVRLAKGDLAFFASRVGFVGAAGPVAFGMWRLYCYLVRYDPRSGYFGLQSVRVLLLSVLLFVAVGVLLGAAAAHLNSRFKHRKV